MIIDRIENAEKYSCLGPRFARAFAMLRSTDFLGAPPGRVEVEGSGLYYMVQEYKNKPQWEGKTEAHRLYADIQAVLAGRELIGYGDLSLLKPGEYDPEKDVVFAGGRLDFVTVRAGYFMLLLPNDAHMPGIRVRDNEQVKKVVFKVRLPGEGGSSV